MSESTGLYMFNFKRNAHTLILIELPQNKKRIRNKPENMKNTVNNRKKKQMYCGRLRFDSLLLCGTAAAMAVTMVVVLFDC